MTDTSGPTSGKQFAYYDPASQSWRMWPATGLWGSIAFSETWPRTGCMSDGQAFELPTSAPPITEKGSSSSRPPTVFSTPDTMPDAPNSGSNMRTRPPGLGNQVKVLPTPDTNPGGGGPLTTAERRAQGRTASVFNAVMEMGAGAGNQVKTLPTPLASDGEKERNNPAQARRKSPPLSAVNHLLPTPVAQPSGNTPENHLRKKPGREVVTDLAIIVENDLLKSGGKVLPPPEAKNAHAGPDYARKGRKKSGGDDLVTVITKMSTGAPTPPLFDAGSD